MSAAEDTVVHDETLHGCQVTTVEVRTKQAAAQLGRAAGRYITMQMKPQSEPHDLIGCEGECLAALLSRVFTPHFQKKLLVCGLGNPKLPADCLGPEVVHTLPLGLTSLLGSGASAFRDVCAFIPGVYGVNNIKTDSLVSGIVQACGADCLLLVDSLTADDPGQLFAEIQISTAGGTTPASPGDSMDWAKLDLPVFSIGAPASLPLHRLCPSAPSGEFLSSVNAAEHISRLGALIAYALIRVFWPGLTRDECLLLAKLDRDPLPYTFPQSGMVLPPGPDDSSRI